MGNIDATKESMPGCPDVVKPLYYGNFLSEFWAVLQAGIYPVGFAASQNRETRTERSEATAAALRVILRRQIYGLLVLLQMLIHRAMGACV